MESIRGGMRWRFELAECGGAFRFWDTADGAWDG